MDLPLLQWLDTYTFPKESEFAETEHARNVYSKVVDRFLNCGTTTCSWYATIHLEACKTLTDIIEQRGQRAYIGKVNMDQNSPDYYIETTEGSVQDTRTFIEYVKAKNNDLVTPIITPRFAISCTSPLLKALGDLAQEYKVPIQSHLCENIAEIEFAKSLFPKSAHYTGIYDDHGLLNDRTIMAHCVHMTEEELELIKEREAGISHCPNSNFGLQSGVCDIKHYMDRDIKCGLGSDLAGGFATSILDAMRTAFLASNTIGIMKSQYGKPSEKPYKALDASELIYLATLGGAKVVGMEDKIGNFQVGKDFDALVIDASDNGPIRLFRHDGPSEMLQKFLFMGDERSLTHVYVKGRRVAGWKP
jgi:guanine deaminase